MKSLADYLVLRNTGGTFYSAGAMQEPVWMIGAGVGLVGVIAAFVVVGWRLRFDFVVRVRGGRVRVTGRPPRGLRGAAGDLFENDFPHDLRLTIFGRVRPDRTVYLYFRGRVSAGDQQRIRNFFAAHR